MHRNKVNAAREITLWHIWQGVPTCDTNEHIAKLNKYKMYIENVYFKTKRKYDILSTAKTNNFCKMQKDLQNKGKKD